MNSRIARALAAGLIVISTAAALSPIPFGVTGDPIIKNNPDGTSDAIWDFTTPTDYTLTNTEIVGGNVTLERQPTYWWNSTSLTDFSNPESMTNVTLSQWPGEVAIDRSAGPYRTVTIQPGTDGVDTYLSWTDRAVNFGSSQTIVLNGQAHPILRFDLSAIPANVVIDSATLNLYQTTGEGNPVVSMIHYLTNQWDETQATWENRLAGVPWTTGGGDYALRIDDLTAVDITSGWKSWNVTGMVDQWYRGILVNRGLIIEGPNPGPNCNKVFFSSEYAVNPTLRPKLDITYRTIGVSGEYVSRVGGPGNSAIWKDISWNPSVHDQLSDEFDGSSLDQKWTWTNSPAAFDVGTTMPGSLHVLSDVGVTFNAEIFTGNLLWQDLVGDFTITMKYRVNPTVEDQEAGLLIRADDRNWYSIGKENSGNSNDWRVQATDDGVTSIRMNTATSNPIPAWLRIERAGNRFMASTSSGGTTWTMRDSYTPASAFPKSVRAAFFVDDGTSGTPLPVDIDYIRFTLPDDAKVEMQTRIGNSTTVDSTWSAWTASYPNPTASSMSGKSRYIEYRLIFSVMTPGHIPVVRDVNISWYFYPLTGTIETNDLVPSSISAWGDFTVVENLNGQTISYWYSLDSGGSWVPVIPPCSLQSVSIATGRIRFRANLSTIDVLVSPSLGEMRFTYSNRIDHFYIQVPPTAMAGNPFSITVSAKDSANMTIVSWTGMVDIEARLQDGVTNGGGVLGTTSIMISAGGTATLATETYTKAEVIRIFASFGPVGGLSDNMTILPGAVDHISVSPSDVTILAMASQVFTATGYDFYGNPVSGLNFTWTVNGGVGNLNSSWGQVVLLTAIPPAANGTVTVSYNSIIAIALVHVTLGTPPWIIITTPVPRSLLTGFVPINYSNSSDAVSVRFDYYDGNGWTFIGTTTTLLGVYYWDTSGLDIVNGILLATVANGLTAVNMTTVSPLAIDNTPPTIVLRSAIDNQLGNGTLTIAYTTVPDVVRVDFAYFDGTWHAIGSDLSIDGSYVWIPGSPINGVTLRAIAVDRVGLIGDATLQGVGNYILGQEPPSIAPIPDLHVHVVTTYYLNLTFYVTDPDTPLASLLIWNSDPANVIVNPGDHPSLEVTYATSGTYLVTLWVSDGTDTAWTLVRVIASDQSPPSLIVPIPSVTYDEDTVLFNGFGTSVATFFVDLDGDPLRYSVMDASNVFIRLNPDSTVDFWATMHWFGTERLRLRAVDPSGGFAEGAFTVIVRDVNQPPTLIASFPAVSFKENSILFDAFGRSASSYFNDPDGDPLAISILGGLNVNSRVNPNGRVDLWGAANWSGSETLTVHASDPSGDSADGTFVVTVVPVNHPPIVTSALPTVAFNEDSVALDVFVGPLTTHFYDIDGDALEFTISGGTHVFWRINANKTVDMWSSLNWHGQERLRVRATDSNGSWVETSVLIIVLHMNHVPILVTSFPTVIIYENIVGLDVFGGDAATHFFDADWDPLTLTVFGGSQVSSRVNVNGTVDAWAPMNWYGSESLWIRATDASGSYAEGAFQVFVRFVDQPPVLGPIPDLRIDEGARLTLDIASYITDIDTPLSKIVTTTDSHYVMANGTILVLAYPREQGDTVFVVTVSDGTSTASQHVRVTFVPPWWKNVLFLSMLLFLVTLITLLAATILVGRERWRPAKAFLLNDQRQLIREFAFDPSCEVTFDDVVKAGAQDVMGSSVKVGEYQAQLVKGDFLAIILVARSPITPEHAEYVRGLLTNVHDKSEDAVHERLRAAVHDFEDQRKAFNERSKAFEGAVDATTVAMSKLEAETKAVQLQHTELAKKETILKAREETLANETEKLQHARELFETRRKEFEELAIRFEDQSRRRIEKLKEKSEEPAKVPPRSAGKRKAPKA